MKYQPIKNNMNKATELKKFLIENNCKNEFIYNMKNARSNLRWHIDFCSEKANKNLMISGGFMWDSTPQGENYWMNIYHKWRNR